MKILKYDKDGNKVLVVNKNLLKYDGNIYYYIKEDSVNNRHFAYFYLNCNNICYPLAYQQFYDSFSFSEYFTKALLEYKNKDENAIIDTIIQKKQNNQYINNLDIMFCELCNKFDLVKELQIYHQEKVAAIEKERQQREDEYRREEEERQQKEKAAAAKFLEESYNSLKTTNTVSAKGFEVLCKDNNINLPFRFVGWLREYCRDITITRDEDMQDGYFTSYMYIRPHKSNSIWKYAAALAKAINL